MPGMNLIDVGGSALEVLQIPAAATGRVAAPLVFLHEGLGSVAMWRDWPHQVARATGRAAWVYSRRGYGSSQATPDVHSPPRREAGLRHGRLLPDYLHHEAFDVLPLLLRQLGVTAPPVLVGHSDGGSIALLYASLHRVAACVVLAPHVVVEEQTITSITVARQAYLSGDLRQRLAPYHADVDCAFWQWNDIWLDPQFRSFDIRADCHHITAPLLAIQGHDDPYGSMRQIDEIVPHAAPIQREKLDACGHAPQRDQRLTTNRLLTQFLRTAE